MTKRPSMKIGIVVPCYNEEEVLPITAERLLALLKRLVESDKISADSKIFFVDDGSKDQTWSIIEMLLNKSRHISGIKLSRNQGHQNALLAGLFTADGDALISIDADLQDDIEVIEQMVEEYRHGIDIVYGVRKKRDFDGFFKRLSAEIFYKFMNQLGAESVYNHADYRLMSRRAIEALKNFNEINLFLRGIVPLLGFRTSIAYYDRKTRFAGQSKYTFKKMIALALDGITSFSIRPLRIITFLGFVIFALTTVMIFWILWSRLFSNTIVPGWASTVLPMYLLGGIQILCIGVLGEYLGKIYREVKARPRYIIEKIANSPER
jgi:glycosyltransferase involved in cell wall biosynthesis